MALLPLLMGCQAIINKRTVIVERAGTVVVTTKNVKTEALVPDEKGSLVPADIVIPQGSQVKIGEPKAPKPEIKK